jgi:phosphotransferase system HPr (HPr) family protein
MIGRPFGARPPRADSPAAAEAPAACVSLHEGPDAMNGNTFQQTVRVTNPNGLHLRPATAFAELARRFQSKVTVSKDGRGVDGKLSPLELLLLVVEQGNELVVEASGPDAHEALAALVQLLEDWNAQQDPEPPLPPKG